MERIKLTAAVALSAMLLIAGISFFTGSLETILPILAISGIVIAVTLLVITLVFHYREHKAPKIPEVKPAPVHKSKHEVPKPELKQQEMIPKHVFQHDHGIHHQLAYDPAHTAQKYITKMRDAGISDAEIKKRLVSVGWDPLAIDMEMMKK